MCSPAALADPTTIYSGGSEIVSAGGTDDGAQISGGTQLDYGLASGATIVSGVEVIEAGGCQRLNGFGSRPGVRVFRRPRGLDHG